jgi:hypothetical protein
MCEPGSSWIVLGLVVGLTADKVTGSPHGIIVNTLIGIAGALLGPGRSRRHGRKTLIDRTWAGQPSARHAAHRGRCDPVVKQGKQSRLRTEEGRAASAWSATG